MIFRLWSHTRPLLVLSDSKRPMGFLMVAALAIGLPVLVGAWLGQFSTSVLASQGGLVILYMQQIPITRRMITLVACSLGFLVSFSLGVLTSFNLYLSAGTLGLTVLLVTMVCRFYALPPPGTFFFILAACMSRTLPFDLSLAAERISIVLVGCIGACLLALLYSLGQLLITGSSATKPVATQDRRIAAIFLEATVISVFIGGGYLFALLIDLDNPYWVPISTAAIMQGATFRAVWHRNVHRIVGTFIGMGLAWIIFSMSPNVWVLAGLVILLSFVIEVLVTRNYGLAVIFITPLTVIFADSSIAALDTERLMVARMFDIVLGSAIGYLGGWVIHHPRIFLYLERCMVKR